MLSAKFFGFLLTVYHLPFTTYKMANTSLDKFRNIGIMAHIDAGKNHDTERCLLHGVRINREVEGTATMDGGAEEEAEFDRLRETVWKRTGRTPLYIIDTRHVDVDGSRRS